MSTLTHSHRPSEAASCRGDSLLLLLFPAIRILLLRCRLRQLLLLLLDRLLTIRRHRSLRLHGGPRYVSLRLAIPSMMTSTCNPVYANS